MPVRNVCVARGVTTTTGYTPIYTVPAANILLLKDVRFSNAGAGSMNVSLALNQPGVLTVDIMFVTLAAVAAIGGYAGWVVLNAGDRLMVSCSIVGLEYWASGAVLPFSASAS